MEVGKTLNIAISTKKESERKISIAFKVIIQRYCDTIYTVPIQTQAYS